MSIALATYQAIHPDFKQSPASNLDFVNNLWIHYLCTTRVPSSERKMMVYSVLTGFIDEEVITIIKTSHPAAILVYPGFDIKINPHKKNQIYEKIGEDFARWLESRLWCSIEGVVQVDCIHENENATQ